MEGSVVFVQQQIDAVKAHADGWWISLMEASIYFRHLGISLTVLTLPKDYRLICPGRQASDFQGSNPMMSTPVYHSQMVCMNADTNTSCCNMEDNSVTVCNLCGNSLGSLYSKNLSLCFVSTANPRVAISPSIRNMKKC